jgi:hypothetical protein
MLVSRNPIEREKPIYESAMLRHHHSLASNHMRPRIETCNHCDRPVVLINYYGKMLKGCLSCNLWGRLGGRMDALAS